MISPTERARRPLLRPAIGLAVTAFAVLTSVASLLTWSTSILDVVSYIAIPTAFGGIGAFLWTRVPGNPIGPMLLIATVGFASLIGSGTWVVANVTQPTTDPLAVFFGLVANLTFIPSLVLVIVGIPLIFPDGRFVSPRWRWVAITAIVVVVMAELRVLFGTDDLTEIPGLLRNPFYRPDFQPILATLEGLETLAAIPLFALAVWSLVLRYRRSDDIGRHQIRWLAAASAAAVVAFTISFMVPAAVKPVFEGLGILALNTIPLAIGVAIVRYRLYEIDRLISRGISYAIVSIVLVAAYAAVVLVLQGPIGGLFGTQTVTVAVSTLIVAALFQPVRRRVQRAVDRRFDRAHIDAERTTAAFSERLREQVDIDTVVADLATTARGAVSPTTIQLWLRNLEVAPGTDRSA